ncbi:hypothetical protein NH26_05390 [Flammeovirga pacifica]|uniref:DUF4328 domain-containing protein n=2 Tax=Flammeovirga pacifica TaxID=915059 RepID=A0A1S1YY13_FLAPC|nr:hypothetical protein NH26_05390 [Flammeovirga pacifica]
MTNLFLKSAISEINLLESVYQHSETLNGLIGLNALGQIAKVLCLILTAIFFIKRFRRASYNANQRITHLKYNESDALWAWFIPFLNLVRPLNIMSEMSQELSEYLSKRGKVIHSNSFAPIIWWACWIINNIFAQIVGRVSDFEGLVGDLNLTATLIIVSQSLNIIASLAAIYNINEYNKMEKFYYETDTIDAEELNISTNNILPSL